MTKLLICGSRAADATMIAYAQRAVARAHDLGWEIVVGDATGIDLEVVMTCYRASMKFDCYGIDDRPRSIEWLWRSAHSILPHLEEYMSYRPVEGNYLMRDRVMVIAADRVLGVWNGHSRGTKYTCDYARKLGKPVNLVIPKEAVA